MRELHYCRKQNINTLLLTGITQGRYSQVNMTDICL